MLVGRAGAAACTIVIPKEEVVQRSAQTGTAAEQRYTNWTVQLYQAMLTWSVWKLKIGDAARVLECAGEGVIGKVACAAFVLAKSKGKT